VSEQVIVQKAIGVPLIVILTLIGISLEAFLRSFAKEAGKILAQKLFSPAKRNKMIDSLQVIIRNDEGKETVITANDYQELYLKIKKHDNKKSTKI